MLGHTQYKSYADFEEFCISINFYDKEELSW